MQKTSSILALILAIVILGYLLYPKLPREKNTDLTQVPPENNTAEQFYYTKTSEDEIIVTSPLPGEKITSPLKVTGMARGSWYFEATAPVELINWDGLIIAQSYVTAQGNWMTEDFVPFEGIIEFEKPEFGERATLILHNSNASGLSEYDRAVEMNLIFE